MTDQKGVTDRELESRLRFDEGSTKGSSPLLAFTPNSVLTNLKPCVKSTREQPSAPRHLPPSPTREPNLHCAQYRMAAAGRARSHDTFPVARRLSAAEPDRRAVCPPLRCSFARPSSGSLSDCLRTRCQGRRRRGRPDRHIGEG
jgi:hypothetical protein